ncbi:hypothetical protein GF406_25125 [candidate division KSB1 bacterium]|nr:hypothetical protein [candidate division KSB1 bacterium]
MNRTKSKTHIAIRNSEKNDQNSLRLYATTDFTDNKILYGQFINREQLDGLHKTLASMGVTRHQWILQTNVPYYENYPYGFDLLESVVQSAHKYGLELYTCIKPFEKGHFGPILPHTMPCQPTLDSLKDIRGVLPSMDPFTTRHPEMNLKRRAGTHSSTPISTIRLVKGSDHPTRIKKEHLSLWISTTNNRFVPYEGPYTFHESVEWRFRFPKWRKCRILSLCDLEIPLDHRYILIKCSLADDQGDFTNEMGNILEMEGSNGEPLPLTLSSGPVTLQEHMKNYFQSEIWAGITRYLEHPEIQAEIQNTQKMQAHYQDYYAFEDYELADWKTLDKDGTLAVICGKPEYMPGNLCPVYPEVREHWLDWVRYCLDREVDGINFRASNHIQSPEFWEYGFNDIVLKKSEGKTDALTVSRINGDAYTLFLRQAKELIKSKGKGISIHLEAQMIHKDDRGRLPYLPPNVEWQWQTWVHEIGDEFEFRGGWSLRPWNRDKVIDIFSAVTQNAQKPLVYQSDFHSREFNKPNPNSIEEIKLVNRHPGLDGYVLYETALFTRIDKSGHMIKCPYWQKALEDEFF